MARAIAVTTWIGCVLVGAAAAVQDPPLPAPRPGAPPKAEAVDARLAAFERELLLGRPARVVQRGEPLVRAGGELARDGRAVALVARALFDVAGEAQARSLLEAAQVGPATRGHVELELARLDLALDRLREVERRLASEGEDEGPVRFAALPDGWLLLGRARQRAGREGDAARLLRVFVERWPLHPEAPAAWHMLAQAALRARQPELARTCRERAASLGAWHGYYRARLVQIEEQPENALPRLGLAQLWLSADQPERARAELALALELDPRLARAWALLGELERRAARPAAAIEAYGRALALDAELHEARFNRALLLTHAGRVDAARAEFEHLVAAGAADAPPLLAARLYLARLLLAADEHERARAQHERYRELGGTEPLAPE